MPFYNIKGKKMGFCQGISRFILLSRRLALKKTQIYADSLIDWGYTQGNGEVAR